jgi:hypothetical protein
VGWSENTTILKRKTNEVFKRKYKKKSEFPVSIDSSFVPVDLSKNASFAKLAHIFRSDLCVMSYVISEVFDFEAFLPLLKAMREGRNGSAYVIILDRSDEATKEKINKTIKALKGTVVAEFTKKSNLESDEQASTLRKAFTEISRNPRLTWNAIGYLVKIG